jgi:2-oxoglutarate ferredoxin oxidoreductase subunit gamma
MSRFEVRIAGFGGQGVVTAGYVLGQGACLFDGKNATMTQSYGPEARGGACRSEVVVSEEEIDFPRVVKPDLLVAMSQEAYLLYRDDVKDGGTIIADEDLVSPTEESEGVRYFRAPATRTAEALGNRIVANVVMLGVVAAVTKIVSVGAMKKAVEARWPRFSELNLKALERGIEMGLQLLGGHR